MICLAMLTLLLAVLQVEAGAPPCPAPRDVAQRGCLVLSPKDVLRVYDGDTITIRVEGWPPLFQHMPIRLVGFDAPEIHGRCLNEKAMASLARLLLQEFIDHGEVIELREIGRDKYFRLDAELWVDGASARNHMLGLGVVAPYDGRTRRDWCEKEAYP